MPAPPHRIAATSTEVKKRYKQNAQNISARQRKQLERASELDERAAKFRDSEERRKALKKKREEREAKEERARRQIGVGLATQMVGYSHTQAQLKNGMEAFLGLSKRRADEQRKKDLELTKRLEAIAQEIEKEPWDDDDADDLALDLPNPNVSFGEQWVYDDLDDDSLLEAHSLAISDPVQENHVNAQLTSAPAPALLITAPLLQVPAKDDLDFIRTHGPTNKVIESHLDRLPEGLIELLSQDLSMKLPDWNPPLGLLYKLNPVGLPPHRLRIKIGCVVTVLRDLNTSSQLSKSQHLRILRAENHRLECLVLDGQLEGTKTFLTRVPFDAKYKNQDQFPFRRTQFPIRVAIDFTPSVPVRDTVKSGSKIPAMSGHMAPSNLAKKPPVPVMKTLPPEEQNPSFKLPGFPASKSNLSVPAKVTMSVSLLSQAPLCVLDGWDDFLESGTQIARELSSEVSQTIAQRLATGVAPSPLLMDCLPPMSTQDLAFSMDDLDNVSPSEGSANLPVIASQLMEKAQSSAASPAAPAQPKHLEKIKLGDTSSRSRAASPLSSSKAKPLHGSGKLVRPHQQSTGVACIDLSKLRASQKPPSVSDRPGLKRKTFASPHTPKAPLPKRQCVQELRPVLPINSSPPIETRNAVNEFMMSTQDVASFFDDDDDDDDDNWSFGGSPPIPV